MRRHAKAFSLVELVIVVVILGVLAAIAVPRLSRGAGGAEESALRADLAALRTSIDLYAAEHGGVFPGTTAAGGTYGAAGEQDAFSNQLQRYTNVDGLVSETKDAAHPFGPYLRHPIPPLPVGSKRGLTSVKIGGAMPDVGTGNHGWAYSYLSGEIVPNAPDAETDTDGTPYNLY